MLVVGHDQTGQSNCRILEKRKKRERGPKSQCEILCCHLDLNKVISMLNSPLCPLHVLQNISVEKLIEQIAQEKA